MFLVQRFCEKNRNTGWDLWYRLAYQASFVSFPAFFPSGITTKISLLSRPWMLCEFLRSIGDHVAYTYSESYRIGKLE